MIVRPAVTIKHVHEAVLRVLLFSVYLVFVSGWDRVFPSIDQRLTRSEQAVRRLSMEMGTVRLQ